MGGRFLAQVAVRSVAWCFSNWCAWCFTRAAISLFFYGSRSRHVSPSFMARVRGLLGCYPNSGDVVLIFWIVKIAKETRGRITHEEKQTGMDARAAGAIWT